MSPSLLIAFTLCSTELRAENDRFLIDAIQGASSVTVKRQVRDKSGNTSEQTLQLAAGSKLRSDDLIETGPKASVRVVYPDGSMAIVGRSSRFYAVSLNRPGRADTRQPAAGLQGGELVDGQVRCIVRKHGLVNINSEAKNYRFVIKTKAASLGVRGTDFVVDAPATDPFEVHTMDGQVDLGLTANSLQKQNGKPGRDFVTINRNQYTSMIPGEKTLPSPQTFDPDRYMQKLQLTQPDIPALADKPLPEIFTVPSDSTDSGTTESPNNIGDSVRQKIKGVQNLREQQIENATGWAP